MRYRPQRHQHDATRRTDTTRTTSTAVLRQWRVDVCRLDIPVRVKRGADTERHRPWLMMLMDDGNRSIRAVRVTEHEPAVDDLRHLLRAALPEVEHEQR